MQLPKRALVTGGNGFVGRKIVEMLLEQGCEVTVFDIAQGQQDPRVKCLVGNLVSKVRWWERWRRLGALTYARPVAVGVGSPGSSFFFGFPRSCGHNSDPTKHMNQADVAKAVEGIEVVFHVAAPHASHPPQVPAYGDIFCLHICIRINARRLTPEQKADRC